MLYDIETYDASCRGLADKAGALVVSPNYRRAPEAVFPAAYDDVPAGYRWTIENIAAYGGDPDRMSIGGESVGATMASATCLRLSQPGGPVPVAQGETSASRYDGVMHEFFGAAAVSEQADRAQREAADYFLRAFSRAA